MTLPLAVLVACGGSSGSSSNGGGGGGLPPDTTAPTVTLTNPANAATGVLLNGVVTATFSKTIDGATCTSATFTLKQGTTAVPATVTTLGAVAKLTPTGNLTASTVYTATLTTGVKDMSGHSMAAAMSWTFTTGTSAGLGPAPVVLGTAGTFVILSKSGVTNVPTSVITGNVGTSPITGASITGLGCGEVTGTIYTVDAAGPACRVQNATLLTTAVADMEHAYTDAAGRTLPDHSELGAGNIDGLTLAPGLYHWTTGVQIPVSITISGGPNDVWIFQVAGDLTVSNNATVNLTGGADTKNIFWQVGGQATLGTASHLHGTILSHTLVSLGAGSDLVGRALAQTAVTMSSSIVNDTGL